MAGQTRHDSRFNALLHVLFGHLRYQVARTAGQLEAAVVGSSAASRLETSSTDAKFQDQLAIRGGLFIYM
jgi:hypothetical protein